VYSKVATPCIMKCQQKALVNNDKNKNQITPKNEMFETKTKTDIFKTGFHFLVSIMISDNKR